MANVDRNAYLKPNNEPFRDLDLESCHYCRLKISLAADCCSHCGFERNYCDKNIAKKLLAWRSSDEGKKAWAEITQAQILAKQREADSRFTWNIISSVLQFGAGFCLFGAIGYFFGAGMTSGLVGGSVMSIFNFLATRQLQKS